MNFQLYLLTPLYNMREPNLISTLSIFVTIQTIIRKVELLLRVCISTFFLLIKMFKTKILILPTIKKIIKLNLIFNVQSKFIALLSLLAQRFFF